MALKPPTATDDCRDLWKIVASLVKRSNALENLRVVASRMRNKLTLTESAATLELTGGGGDAAAESTFPWQPYLSPFTGTGTPPADQGRRLRIRPAAVNNVQLPSNLNVEIIVPANQTDPYFVWLKATVNADGNVNGLSYHHGATLPEEPAIITDGSGNLPGTSYMLLFAVTSTADQVNLPPILQNQRTALNLLPVPVRLRMSTTGQQVVQRKLIWSPPGAETSFPTFDTVTA